jgi:hypothetical protein
VQGSQGRMPSTQSSHSLHKLGMRLAETPSASAAVCSARGPGNVVHRGGRGGGGGSLPRMGDGVRGDLVPRVVRSLHPLALAGHRPADAAAGKPVGAGDSRLRGGLERGPGGAPAGGALAHADRVSELLVRGVAREPGPQAAALTT